MRYPWDEGKRTANERKHGVEFADTVSVLDDPLALTIEDRDHDEQRFVTLGMDAFGRVLVVVYTYPEPDLIRILSARKGEPHAYRECQE
ncbi:MAG: BrnT family toxin [Acidiferrobacteraceae bacterium]